LAKLGLGQFLGAGKVASKAFMFKSEDPAELIEEIVGLADEARKGGLLALEGKELSSEFLQGGIQLLVDGHDPDVVKTLMSKDKDKTVERHETGAKIFSALGDVSPAMGMIGTLVGLVAMLSNMDDPKSIGPAMAVALLTTLYGAMLANMVAIPISDKLSLRRAEEEMNKSLVIDALLAIQGGQNPRVIDTMLRNYLPGSERAKDED
jgi:chemotaxis protein MotA